MAQYTGSTKLEIDAAYYNSLDIPSFALMLKDPQTAGVLLGLFDGSDPDLKDDLFAAIQDLLVRKAETEEKDLNPQIPAIIDFIREECVRKKQISDAAPDDHKHDYTQLNDAFRKVLRGWIMNDNLMKIGFRLEMTTNEL